MAINGKIQSEIQIMDDTYDVSVAIPTSKPLAANPYTLTIFSKEEADLKLETENVPMMAHVAASYEASSTSAFPENFYLALSPPANILPTIKANNKVTFAVNYLSIQFATGKYADEKDIPGAQKGTKKPA